MEIAVTNDTSISDIRALLSSEEPVTEAVTEAPATSTETAPAKEPEAKVEEVKAEAQESTEEEKLPPNVEKRIAKEAERAAKAQAAIDRAISERKAKEAEAAKLADKTGSEPAPNTESADGKPVKPVMKDEESWADYQARLDKYQDDRDQWNRAEAVRDFEKKTTEQRQQAEAKKTWDAAVKEHGNDFPERVERLREKAPEPLQVAISQLENWPAMAVYLDKNPAELTALVSTYSQNPVRGTAMLGKIEAKLTVEPKQEAAKPLPPPLPTPGGRANAGANDVDLEKVGMARFKTEVKRRLGKAS
jgi:hypothetical protein